VQVVEGPDGVEAHLRHNTRLLDPAGARALADALSDLLATAADDPETPLAADVQPVAATARPVAATADPRDTDDALTGHVRRIWQEVLKRPHIGLDDDLYDLGGHSLVITQIAARIRKELGDDVSFEVFLDQPTIRGVVDAIRAGR
jgi:acyl carrier protein